MRVKIVCIPVFKKEWLFHAWHIDAPKAFNVELGSWKSAKTFGEKSYLLRQELSQKVSLAAKSQWLKLQESKDGTFKHKLYKLSIYVMEREDPIETFLKSVPTGVTQVQVMYPASVKQEDLKSILLKVAEGRKSFHWSRSVAWGLVCLPQLPFLATPIPSVPLYFSLYRCFSHWMAARGGSKLADSFKPSSGDPLTSSSPFPVTSSSSAPLAADSKGSSSSHASSTDGRGVANAVDIHADTTSSVAAAVAAMEAGSSQTMEFLPSSSLDDICRPNDRWTSPLPTAATKRIVQFTKQDVILSLVQRLKRRLGLPEDDLSSITGASGDGIDAGNKIGDTSTKENVSGNHTHAEDTSSNGMNSSNAVFSGKFGGNNLGCNPVKKVPHSDLNKSSHATVKEKEELHRFNLKGEVDEREKASKKRED
mmetsp:Transcript_667/g.811  ORF Transcript_667/g.811 Transcript_667/m.811 type:complete len:422 (-) Transcript_667:511-1776(-)|eukprot:CAMPEP_0175074672 /NCGR_PEP_ID=MMETSP0052_2-20121109/21463_1 /TAXON_ID=51329 ORGANISM="Polytomella parva, Strain SAG 63-3" /NCGR_SAMPLE_ID=MMETSP0052_2 /ASSEMBLY_ACC=CAM_ASM_000194 /LENGTH=421 /DNA_ID=CAMNT_0016343049 /DNA_START=44 /DNA_END=1309 /DNA_ORIENTATION=-